MLEIGTFVNEKYKIIAKIGYSAYSYVYLAENTEDGTRFAVKEIYKSIDQYSLIYRQKLTAPPEILKKLSHPALPKIFDVTETEESFIIVMEYIDGIQLDSVISEYGKQTETIVLDWAQQLCSVLEYLHLSDPTFICANIKPGTIMKRNDNSLVLLDFEWSSKEKNQDSDCCIYMLPAYDAPEQYGGFSYTDERTDIYRLGATLFHLVTGRSPGEPPYEMHPIRQIDPSLSKKLEMIILKCTERNPDDRFQSVSDVIYALEHDGKEKNHLIKSIKSKLLREI